MNVLPELSEIAAAKYGISLKEPILRAFDKLIENPKFNLLQTFIDDDYKEFYKALNDLTITPYTSRTLKDIIDLFTILNGREAFYAKSLDAPMEQTYPYFLSMLATEYQNSAIGNRAWDGFYERGSGKINGIKMRAAIYYMLDILQCDTAVKKENVSLKASSSCSFCGRDLTKIVIYGTDEGVGYLLPGVGLYALNLEVYNEFNENITYKFAVNLGSTKLYTGQTAEYTFSGAYWEDKDFPYSFYTVKSTEDCDIETFFTITRDRYTPNVSDYIYVNDNNDVTTIYYKGTDDVLMMPEHYDSVSDDLKTVGVLTFADSQVKRVFIPEGTTTIE